MVCPAHHMQCKMPDYAAHKFPLTGMGVVLEVKSAVQYNPLAEMATYWRALCEPSPMVGMPYSLCHTPHICTHWRALSEPSSMVGMPYSLCHTPHMCTHWRALSEPSSMVGMPYSLCHTPHIICTHWRALSEPSLMVHGHAILLMPHPSHMYSLESSQ